MKTPFAILISIVLFTISPLTLFAQEITTHNISEYLGGGKWKWKVYIQASQEILDDINGVEYTLHTTFATSARREDRIGDPRYPFGLTNIGRKPFEISLKVIFKDKEKENRHLKHMLIFKSPPVANPLPIKTGNVADSLGNDRWKWTVFIKGPTNALDRIRFVEYTLHPTFPERVHEVRQRGTENRAFAFSAIGWGTFEIRIRAFLKNGEVQKLSHHLRF